MVVTLEVAENVGVWIESTKPHLHTFAKIKIRYQISESDKVVTCTCVFRRPGSYFDPRGMQRDPSVEALGHTDARAETEALIAMSSVPQGSSTFRTRFARPTLPWQLGCCSRCSRPGMEGHSAGALATAAALWSATLLSSSVLAICSMQELLPEGDSPRLLTLDGRSAVFNCLQGFSGLSQRVAICVFF